MLFKVGSLIVPVLLLLYAADWLISLARGSASEQAVLESLRKDLEKKRNMSAEDLFPSAYRSIRRRIPIGLALLVSNIITFAYILVH